MAPWGVLRFWRQRPRPLGGEIHLKKAIDILDRTATPHLSQEPIAAPSADPAAAIMALIDSGLFPPRPPPSRDVLKEEINLYSVAYLCQDDLYRDAPRVKHVKAELSKIRDTARALKKLLSNLSDPSVEFLVVHEDIFPSWRPFGLPGPASDMKILYYLDKIGALKK